MKTLLIKTLFCRLNRYKVYVLGAYFIYLNNK